MRDDDYRPVEEPFGPDEPDFTDTLEPDDYPDDMLKDEPPEALRETTDDPGLEGKPSGRG